MEYDPQDLDEIENYRCPDCGQPEFNCWCEYEYDNDPGNELCHWCGGTGETIEMDRCLFCDGTGYYGEFY